MQMPLQKDSLENIDSFQKVFFHRRSSLLFSVNYTSDAVEVSEWTWRVEKPRGLLYSPEYPYFYPSFINATYVLPQRKGYHTVLVSNDFDLAEGAVLEVFETSNKGVHLFLFHNILSESEVTVIHE